MSLLQSGCFGCVRQCFFCFLTRLELLSLSSCLTVSIGLWIITSICLNIRHLVGSGTGKGCRDGQHKCDGFQEHICCFTDNRHPLVFLVVGILLPLHFSEKKAAYLIHVDYCSFSPVGETQSCDQWTAWLQKAKKDPEELTLTERAGRDFCWFQGQFHVVLSLKELNANELQGEELG